MSSILKIVEHYWNIHEKHPKMISALIDLVQSITNVMDIEFKRYLPQILPLILKQLQNEISACALNDSQTTQNTSSSSVVTNTNALKILNLLRLCTCCLENDVHLIIKNVDKASDEGTYTCSANNGFGTISVNLTLIVIGRHLIKF